MSMLGTSQCYMLMIVRTRGEIEPDDGPNSHPQETPGCHSGERIGDRGWTRLSSTGNSILSQWSERKISS